MRFHEYSHLNGHANNKHSCRNEHMRMELNRQKTQTRKQTSGASSLLTLLSCQQEHSCRPSLCFFHQPISVVLLRFKSLYWKYMPFCDLSFFLLEQLKPSPTQSLSHWQVYEPSVFTQREWRLQRWRPVAHSSSSVRET